MLLLFILLCLNGGTMVRKKGPHTCLLLGNALVIRVFFLGLFKQSFILFLQSSIGTELLSSCRAVVLRLDLIPDLLDTTFGRSVGAKFVHEFDKVV